MLKHFREETARRRRKHRRYQFALYMWKSAIATRVWGAWTEFVAERKAKRSAAEEAGRKALSHFLNGVTYRVFQGLKQWREQRLEEKRRLATAVSFFMKRTEHHVWLNWCDFVQLRKECRYAAFRIQAAWRGRK